MANELPQDKELPNCMEAIVLEALKTGRRTREEWEELRKEDEPPLSDFDVILENMVGEVERHGKILAQLAVVPETRARLKERAEGAVDRIPAWMEASVYGPPLMTPRLFMRGLAELLAEQREGFESVIEDQVIEAEPLEQVLAESPVPAGSDDESDSEITKGVGHAMTAHVQALLDIAHDLDKRMRALLGPGPDSADR
jgi:hypothetical protein